MNNETEQVFILNSNITPTSIISQKPSVFPETRVDLENVEDFSNVCRTCATVTEFVIPIFDGEGLQNNLADKIHKHLPIQVSETDMLPQVVCYQCASTLLAWHELVACSLQADGALRSRLAVRQNRLAEEAEPISKEAKQNLMKEETKFSDIAEFVVQSLQQLPSRVCDYCGAEIPSQLYDEHLTSSHTDLLFHCDDCNTYVDKKNFLLHMSLHADQYTTKKRCEFKKQLPKNKKKTKKMKVKTETAEKQSAKQNVDIKSELKSKTTVTPDCAVEHDNAFSDHSDVEYGFDPLPDSVFEAIEDSQDSQSPDFINNLSNTGNKRPLRKTSATSVENNESLDTNATFEMSEKKYKRPRTCPICLKVYKASSSYFYHMKYYHRQSKEHECDICGRKFGTKGSLTQHTSIHTGECELECKDCGKKFRSKASLYIHEQTHNGIKRYSCSKCHRSFRWRTHLQRHVKRHLAEKAHVCSTCGRGFSIRGDLLRHARTHSAGEFKCDKCGVKLAQLRYLKVHMEKKHSAIITNDTSASN